MPDPYLADESRVRAATARERCARHVTLPSIKAPNAWLNPAQPVNWRVGSLGHAAADQSRDTIVPGRPWS